MKTAVYYKVSQRIINALVVVLFYATMTANSLRAASTIAASITGGDTFNVIQSYTVGWSFSISQPIQVDTLGWFDYNADGLSVQHHVGIWNGTSQLLLTSATIPSGDGTTLIDSFRYVAVGSPVILAPGQYVIGGVAIDPPDEILDLVTVTTAPEITYLQARGADSSSSSLMYPSSHIPSREQGFFGPNFSFTPVPEPGSVLMLVLGGLSLAFGRVRRRRP